MTKKNMKARLDSLYAQKKDIEKQIRELYKESLNAPDDEKMCPDWMAKSISSDDRPKFIEYPVTINGIHHEEVDVVMPDLFNSNTKWVAVRPVGKKYVNNTYLGVFIGEIATSVSCRLNRDGILSIGHAGHNPAIYVPDLHEIIFGMASWWKELKSPEDLKKITNSDIENTWYVRAMKELS